MPKQTTTWMHDSRTLKNQEALVFELGNSISISDRKSLEMYLSLLIRPFCMLSHLQVPIRPVVFLAIDAFDFRFKFPLNSIRSHFSVLGTFTIDASQSVSLLHSRVRPD